MNPSASGSSSKTGRTMTGSPIAWPYSRFPQAPGKCAIDRIYWPVASAVWLAGTSLWVGWGARGTAAPGPPARFSIQAGNNQQAPVGTAVGTPPAVFVADQNGDPVPAVSVAFTVASGGGSATAGTTQTNSSGVATVGSWKLGAALGTNTLTATAAGSGIAGNPVTFTATGTGCNNCWRNVASMPTARSLLAVEQVNGILYAVGGHTSSNIGGVLPTVEAYDASTDTWTTKAPMPTARAGLAVTVVNGMLYAIGGYSDTGSVRTVEAFDPATNTWTTKAPMPTARDGLATAAIDGIIYAVGGQGGGQAFVTVEAYDPATNSWSTKDSMQVARNALGATAANSILYAIGGSPAGQGGGL